MSRYNACVSKQILCECLPKLTESDIAAIKSNKTDMVAVALGYDAPTYTYFLQVEIDDFETFLNFDYGYAAMGHELDRWEWRDMIIDLADATNTKIFQIAIEAVGLDLPF